MKLLKLLPMALVLMFPHLTLAATGHYWADRNGQVVRDGSGECVKAIHYGKDFPECRGEVAMADSDNDGVSDAMDQCPGTPAGVRVDARGCPLVQDADGDGVPDNADRCPNTPANVTVDAAGCPRDSDRDGVADYLDRCPNTPAGSVVNTRGCPQRIVVRDLNFASNSAEITAESRTALDKVLLGIKGNPAITQITVTGYTDSQGDAAYNKSLSERRAKAVADYLREQGLDGVTIHSVGMGEENPVESNATAEGRAQNRRVEIDLKQ
jgi:OOP family OmpA-OmpF porin